MNPLFLLALIIVPLLGGLLIIIFQPESDRKRNVFAQFVVCLTSVLVWIAIAVVKRGRPVEIYSFTENFFIELLLDGPGMLFAGMISILWPLVMPYAFGYMEHEHRKNGFFGFFVMTYGVTLGVAFSGNITTLYVFYEMLSLVTIPLVSHYMDHESMYAGRKYAAYTIGGASLAFFPVIVSTLWGHSGHFIYGGSIVSRPDAMFWQAAFLFGFFGFGVKAAVFPLHSWLPTASAAPTPVTALLHAVAVVNSGVFAIIRMVWYVFGPDLLRGSTVVNIALLTAEFTLVYAAFMAVKERHFKRRLAYSTVSNLSYMLTGILLLTPYGLEAGMMHMVFHSVIKMTLFLCAGAFMHVTGRSYVYEVDGVGKRLPVTFVMYTLSAFSLTGIPLLCGFVSKWHLVLACLDKADKYAYIGAAALILSAFACAIYTISVSVRAFFPMLGMDRYAGEAVSSVETETVSGKSVTDPGTGMLIPIVLFSIINVFFGIWPQPLVKLLETIASGL